MFTLLCSGSNYLLFTLSEISGSALTFDPAFKRKDAAGASASEDFGAIVYVFVILFVSGWGGAIRLFF